VELVEVRYFKQYGSNTVELLIWKKSGISLNDCEDVHNLVSDELDKLDDLFSTAYTLNISSLGLDRKIVTDDDFRRALGTEIECVSVDKKKTVGVLDAYDGDSITVLAGTQKKTILRNNLTKVQPYVRF
ncbi:MAG: ribosome maturation factor RimP, partial [Clostridia bacterium]|nr:ribosome maturation factor RimP [Clostridia bacterium]